VSESSDTSTNSAVADASATADSKGASKSTKSAVQRSLHGRLWELVTYALLYALSVGGILYMEANAEAAVPYWELVVGIVAVIAILAGWSRSPKGGGGRLVYLSKAVLHWAALIGVLYLLLLHQGRLELDFQSMDLVLIYLLGLGCFLVGVHLDARMLVLGVYLVAAGLLSQDLLDTGGIDTTAIEGLLSHKTAILVGGAVAGLILTALLDVITPKR